MSNKFIVFFEKNWWWLVFLIFLFAFSWKVVLKGFLIGPFDFLVGFYDPYYEIKWSTQALFDGALHYKNDLLSDVVSVVLPPKLLGIQLIKQGQLPLWNPYLMNGTPLLASVQSAVLYWANIFYLLFDPKLAYNIYILLQPILSFFFMFLYLRNHALSRKASYFGSLSFSFSAFFVVWLPWGTLGHAFLWLPLILYCVEKFIATTKKKYVFWYIFGLVSSFFAGHTQTSIMVFLTVFFYQIYLLFTTDRKKTIQLFAFFLISCLLISIQLLPSIEMYQESAREVLSGEEFYQTQTLLPSSFIQLFAPDFFGNPVTRNWWGRINYAESAIYFGTVAVFFVIYFLGSFKGLLTKKTIFFVLLMLGGLLLSVKNPLSNLIYILKLPLLSSSTFARYSALFIFASTILGAYGFEWFINDIDKKNYRRSFWTIFIFSLFLALIWGATVFDLWRGDYKNNISILKRNIILPSMIIGLLSGAILASSFFKKTSFIKKSLPFFIILLLSIELFRFSYKYIPFSPPEYFYPPHPLIAKLQELTMDGRYTQYFPPNVNSIYRIRGVEGKEPLQNLKIATLASMGRGGEVDIFDRTGLQFPSGQYKERVLDLFSTKYFVDKTDNFRNSWIDDHDKDNELFDRRFREIWTDKIFKIYENNDSLARFNIFYKEEVYVEPNRQLIRLIDPRFDYKNTVITGEKVLSDMKEGKYSIILKSETQTAQDFDIFTSKPGILAVTDTNYPGWKVLIDGKEGDIIPINYAFRGVRIEEGNHNVRFIYDSPVVKRGMSLSFLGLILAVIYFVKSSWKKLP